MIVTWSSLKGSPGVSSWCLLTAAAWADDGRPRVVVEIDRDGGSIPARMLLGADPGLADLLAIAARPADTPVDLRAVSHRVDDNTYLVAASPYGSAVSTLLSGADVGESLVRRLAGDGRWWFFDVGRHALTGSLVPLTSAADVSVIVTRSEPEYLAVSKPLVEWSPNPVVLVVGKPEYPKSELADWFGAPVMVVGAESVVELASGCFTQRRLRRVRAFREAREFGDMIEHVAAGGVVAHAE